MRTRDKIVYWFTIVWGVLLATFQTYKYFTDTLNENTTIEIVVFCISILLLLKPSYLVSIVKKLANDKINK